MVTYPLADYMDNVSFVETIRHRTYLRNSGLTLPDSKCRATLHDLIDLNRNIISGATGLKAVRAFLTTLQMSDDADVWMPWMTPKLQYRSCFDMMVEAMANAFRRLVFPFQCLPWSLFKIVGMDCPGALNILRSLDVESRSLGCHCCRDPSFAEPIFEFVLEPGLSIPTCLARVQTVQELLADTLRDLPASTVQVEKLHANVQVVCRSDRSHAPRQKTVHVNTYIMSAKHLHSSLKEAVEQEVLGANKGKVMRLLSARVLQSSAPAALGVRKVKKNLKHKSAFAKATRLLVFAYVYLRLLGNYLFGTLLGMVRVFFLFWSAPLILFDIIYHLASSGTVTKPEF